MTVTILLLEDDESLNRGVSLKLTKEGYQVLSAFSIAEAGTLLQQQPDLIICDVGLPDGSGLDFCQYVRKQSNVQFIFLTALDTELDIINGFEAGADDYITKPFSLMVLLAKVHAIIHRLATKQAPIIHSGALRIEPEAGRAAKNGALLSLSPNEWKLLCYFLQNPRHILSKEQLLQALWQEDSDFADENTVAVNIRRLREKIEDDPSQPCYVKNVRGLGYIWEMECNSK